LVAVQQGRAINVQDINRLVRNLEFQGGSPHHTVVQMYWGSFFSELCNCTSQRDSESVVRRYIICSIWSAYWEQREHLKPFNNWKEAKKVLLRTTMQIVELRSREKWEKMKDIRDRFLFRREYVAALLENSNHDISEVITRAFNTSQTTWNCGLKGIADNMKHGGIPTGSEGAAVLILAWAIDSQKSSDICSLTISPEFYRALEQWKSVANNEVLKFIDFCWPCCEDCKRENIISTPLDAKEDTDLQMLFKSVTDYFAAPSDSTKDVARNILFDCMNSDDSDIFGSDISLEACVIDVALELEDPESIHTLSATSPHVHDSVRPPEDPAQPNDVKYGICTNHSLFGGALLIGVIVAQFLIGMIASGAL